VSKVLGPDEELLTVGGEMSRFDWEVFKVDRLALTSENKFFPYCHRCFGKSKLERLFVEKTFSLVLP
jgi:hypothetical protein